MSKLYEYRGVISGEVSVNPSADVLVEARTIRRGQEIFFLGRLLVQGVTEYGPLQLGLQGSHPSRRDLYQFIILAPRQYQGLGIWADAGALFVTEILQKIELTFRPYPEKLEHYELSAKLHFLGNVEREVHLWADVDALPANDIDQLQTLFSFKKDSQKHYEQAMAKYAAVPV